MTAAPMPPVLAFLAGFSLWVLLCLLAAFQRASRQAEADRRERASAAAGGSRLVELIPQPPRLVQRGTLYLPHCKETTP